MKNRILLTAGLSMALYGSAALAVGEPTDTVTIDFTGSDPLTGNEEVGSLDWAVGSSLALGAIQAGEDFVLSGGSCTGTGIDCSFEIYTHGALQGYADEGGNPVNPLGNTSLWEWTFVFGGTELVSDASFTVVDTGATDASGNKIYSQTSSQTFSLNSNDIFFEVYYDDLTDGTGLKSNILNGTGFDDGTLILSSTFLGHISGSFSSTQYSFIDLDGNGVFTTGDQILEPALLDSFGIDNWANQPATGDITYTASGEGATDLEAEVAGQDFAFFKDLLDSLLFDLAFSTENVIPFNETNPSFCYDNTAATVGVGDTTGGSANLVCLQQNEIIFADLDTIILSDGTVLTAQDFINGASPYSTQAFNDCVVALGPDPDPADVAACFVPADGQDIIFQTDANQSFRIAKMPEPGSIALLGMGLGMLGLNGIRRRRRGPQA